MHRFTEIWWRHQQGARDISVLAPHKRRMNQKTRARRCLTLYRGGQTFSCHEILAAAKVLFRGAFATVPRIWTCIPLLWQLRQLQSEMDASCFGWGLAVGNNFCITGQDLVSTVMHRNFFAGFLGKKKQHSVASWHCQDHYHGLEVLFSVICYLSTSLLFAFWEIQETSWYFSS